MPTYDVLVTQEVRGYATWEEDCVLQIEAASPEEAQRLAVERAESDEACDMNWEPGEMVDGSGDDWGKVKARMLRIQGVHQNLTALKGANGVSS